MTITMIPRQTSFSCLSLPGVLVGSDNRAGILDYEGGASFGKRNGVQNLDLGGSSEKICHSFDMDQKFWLCFFAMKSISAWTTTTIDGAAVNINEVGASEEVKEDRPGG
jgi:hypothetical protein